jgi:hypothetical protein
MTAPLAVFLCVASIGLAAPAAAQEWDTFESVQDGFKVLFPGKPTVTDTTWISEYEYKLPARIYSANRGAEKYTVTVVDYNAIEAQGKERASRCSRNAQGEAADQCIGSEFGGEAHWKHDTRGAPLWAVYKFLERDAKVTRYFWGMQDRVEGHHLQMTNNPDGSRTFAVVLMHDMKLYIMEGTVPAKAPEPALFQQSAGWLDHEGKEIRYQGIYINQIHGLEHAPPPRVGEGGRRQTPYRP